MIWFTAAVIILFGIITWGYVDFFIGSHIHQKHAKHRMYPVRQVDCSIIKEGTKFFETFFQDLEEAKHSIRVQFFIIKNDQIGQELIEILKEKARQGISVELLIDSLGSRAFIKKQAKKLIQYGIKVGWMEKPHLPLLFYSLNSRNHRKITVIDGKIGYIGGYNIGDAYLGRDPRLGHWRDYHLRLVGEAIYDLDQTFISDWYKATNNQLQSSFKKPNSHHTYPFKVQILSTDGIFIEDFFIKKMNEANTSIFIGSPYFVPGNKPIKALINALDRGVEVNILLPMKSDHPLVQEGSFPYLEKLLKSGAKIYRYYQGFYHSKVIIVDNKFCDVGTANFDLRSFYLNGEANCLIYTPELISKVHEVVQHDLLQSERLTIEDLKSRSLFQKGKEWLALSIARLL